MFIGLFFFNRGPIIDNIWNKINGDEKHFAQCKYIVAVLSDAISGT